MNRWVAPGCTMALVIAIAVMSSSPVLKSTFHTHGVLHPWLHVLVFGLASFSAVFCSERPNVRGILLASLILFGWSTEYYEHLTNGLDLEQADVVQDVFGVAMGGALAWLVAHRARTPQQI